MRRAAFVGILSATVALAGACSSSPFGTDERRTTLPPATAEAGPIPTSQQFDHPFPIAGENWDATVTLSNLRVIPTSYYTDTILAIDVRAVQASGQPELAPGDFAAYSPSGEQLEQIEKSAGLVTDPLVPSTLTYPGEEITGMVAWKMPAGGRVGRIELTSPRSKASITVTLQPVDPSAQSAANSAS